MANNGRRSDIRTRSGLSSREIPAFGPRRTKTQLRLYASLAPRNGVNGVKFRGGALVPSRYYSPPPPLSLSPLPSPPSEWWPLMEMRMNERTNEWSPETRFPSFSACWNFSNEPRFYMSPRNFFHSPSLPLLFFLVFFRSAPLSDFRIGLFILNICCISRSAFCFEGLEFFNWNVEMCLIVDLWDESVKIVFHLCKIGYILSTDSSTQWATICI